MYSSLQHNILLKYSGLHLHLFVDFDWVFTNLALVCFKVVHLLSKLVTSCFMRLQIISSTISSRSLNEFLMYLISNPTSSHHCSSIKFMDTIKNEVLPILPFTHIIDSLVYSTKQTFATSTSDILSGSTKSVATYNIMGKKRTDQICKCLYCDDNQLINRHEYCSHMSRYHQD